MADIDKSLPNSIRTSVEIDGPEVDVEETQEQQPEQPVEVTPMEDGGVELNFEPGKVNISGTENHYDNLAELLPEDILDPIGLNMRSDYAEYKTSRKEWEQAYVEGLDLLGFKYNNRAEPFQGASGATHPVLAEAVTQFQAGAYKELLPSEGPVRSQILGKVDQAKEQQAQRVKDFMNYQIMEKMEEYEPEFDQMLFYLPLSGSAFKKVYYDHLLQRAVSKFVPADDLVVPYTATSLDDAEAIIHVIKISENDLRKQQVGGFYTDIELQLPSKMEDKVTDKERELEGTRSTGRQENIYTLLECHVNLDLEGFEDVGENNEPTGIKLPYIVTIEEGSGKVLSIRRNFAPEDPTKNKIQYFVHFKFLPGLGFYGLGLIHMIGGLSRTATAALRQLLDAGTLSNLPAGFKQRGVRVRDEASPIQPGEFKDVDAPGGNLRDAFYPLPYKEPSQTLLQLMGIVVQAGQRFASIADMQVGDGNQQAAVGTTVALLERGSRVMSAIHKRLYSGLKKEFKLLSNVFKSYLPPEYPYDVVGAEKTIKQTDFDDRVDILPVADPNIFSQTQRISIAQTEMQLAASNPELHNQYEVFRNMYEALGVKDIDLILKKPEQPAPLDPALEHIAAMGSKPFQAFPGQDHRAHMTAHLNFLATNLARNAPMVSAAVQKNCMEHISLMGQEQIELEFRDELQELAKMQQMMQQNPQIQQQMVPLQQKIEARKAILIADMTEDYMKEEKEITGDFGNDPIAQLRARELDIRAQDNEQKRKDAEDRLNLEKMKTMMNQSVQSEKMDQTEELAELRANTSLEKQEMANEAREKLAMLKNRGN